MNLTKTALSLLSCLPLCSYGIVFDLNVTVPDIVTTNIQVDYDSTAKQLTASGISTNLKLNGDPNNPIFAYGNNYELVAYVDENGELYQGTGGLYGYFTITGAIDYDNNGFPDAGSVTILTGEIFAFDGGRTWDTNYPSEDAAPTSSPVKYTDFLEFRFEATGGSEQSTYTGAATYNALKGGIILNANGANIAGDWTQDWSSNIDGASDTSVTSQLTLVPEASSLALQFGVVALLFAAIRRPRN